MANDLFRTDSEDDKLIDLNSDADLARRSERWKVSKEELRRAIEHVGPRVKDVRQHLIGGFTPAGPTS
jgi:hypothetical protein